MSTQGRAQFTPGPWRVINDKTIVGADYPGQGYVADVNLHRNSDAQEVDGQANATLIAAAPAMYEALQSGLEIIEYFVREQRKAGIEEDDCIGIGDLRNFKTVLSQAEGR